MPKNAKKNGEPASIKAAKKTVGSTNAVFDQAYASLNPQQRSAVDFIDGPVMVVAGPGTGKTQVLALRVANILRKTQMKPWNILCLTFSKSGASAMRKRLREIIGPDAYGVTVNTMHGFCNDIIRSHPSVFEEWSCLKQISDVERHRSLNTIIDQLLPGLHLVNAKSPYARTRDILGRIQQLKREGVTDRDRLETIAQEYDAHMESKSKVGTKIHARNMLSALKFREFLEIFYRYQAMLLETGRYDFEDMILNVIHALEEEDWLLAGVQERYQYLLVDEFQDTNGAQYRLIEQLTTDPTPDKHPNVFIVGDDDQAIYRFQGANLKNILSFRERFTAAPIIPLTTSYRCTQPILDAAESLIEKNTERLVGRVADLDKHLVAATKEKGVPPFMLFAASDMAEPWLIADLVDDRLHDGIAPDDIAVIVQTNAELLPLHEVFKARSIPVVLSGKLDLLSHPLVGQTLAILGAIMDPQSNAAFSSALSCACFGCHPADIATLNSATRERRTSLMEIALSMEKEDFALRQSEPLVAARDILLDLHNKSDLRTVLETLEHVYRDCGILHAGSKGMDIIDFAAAQEFFDRISRRAYEQPHFSFRAFLDDLSYYQNPDNSDLRLSYDLPHLTESGVQLMTAHKSKGLEFHTVILGNFREGHWDKRRNPSSLSVPEDLLFGWEKDQKSFEQNQDERRVAFVAMTRAKRELLFICPNELTDGDSVKAVSPSGFFAECGNLSEEHRDVAHPEQMSTLLTVPVRDFDEELRSYLKKRIEHFKLSPTALTDFLDDPQRFIDVHLLQVPQAKEPHFAYGNAVHHVLAQWAESVREGKVLPVADLLAVFTRHLSSDELLTKKEYERLLHLGEQTIRRFAQSNLTPPYPIVHKVEFNIDTHLGDIPIKGKIDRIDLLEPHSSACVVTDFKTGKPKSPKQILDYGYHRQLVFYDLLIRNGYGMLEPKEFRLEFVGEGADDPETRSYAIGEGERRELTALIETVWSKIIDLDFTPISCKDS